MTSAIEAELAAEAQAGGTDASQARPSWRAWYALAAIIVTMFFGYIDRQILVLLVQPIKHDLSLSDLQIGETHGLSPALFSAVAMFPLAWLADRFERRSVLCGCVIFWSIATAVSGLAANFASLQACTVAIAIGEAGLTPIVYSLIPDLFPVKYRPRANIITYGSTALGAGLGLALGGVLVAIVGQLRPIAPAALQTLATWRLAFFLVAIPGPLLALAVFLIGRTRRQVSEQTPAPKVRVGPYAKAHGLVAFGAFGTMAFFSFALLALGTWLPIALIRSLHASAASVGVGFGLTYMAGVIVGLVTAALITPLWRRLAGTAFVLRAICVASGGAAIPTFLLVFAATAWQAYVLFFCISVIFITGVSLMPGMMQDVAPPELRARVIAAGTVLFMVVGSVAPPLVGFISDHLSGNPHGLIWAIVGVTMTGFLLCSALARFMEGPYRRTVAAVAAA